MNAFVKSGRGIHLIKSKAGRLFGTTMMVSLVVLSSKALGFLRDIIMAHMHGTSAAMDAYNAAYGVFYIPILLMNSCITSTLVPLYIQEKEERDLLHANRFASNTINIFSILCLLITALMMVFARPIVSLVHAGFAPETTTLTVRLVRIMLPSLLFFVLAILLSSVLNANKKFMAAQLTGFPLSFALITSTLLSGGPDGIEMLAWGVAAAGVLQVAVEYPFAHKVYRYSPRLNVRDERFIKLVHMAVPALLSMAVNELNHMIDRSLASGLPAGSISAMNYAFKLITFALGVLIVPLTTIMFSRMSEKVARQDKEGMLDILSSCVETILMVTVPVTILGCVLSKDVIGLAYGRGNFGTDSVAMTSGVFLFYLLGLSAFSLRDLFNRAFHSLKDTKTPMYTAWFSVAANIVLNLILVRVMGANGLALATSISALVSIAILVILLRKKMGRMNLTALAIEVVKIAISGVLCLAACLFMNRFIPAASNTWQLLGRLVLIAGIGMILHLACAVVLKCRCLAAVRRRLIRK